MGVKNLLTSLALGILLPQMLLAEEGSSKSNYFRPVPRPGGLLKHEKEYLDWVEGYIADRRQTANARLRRYYATMITAASSIALQLPATALSWPTPIRTALAVVSSVALAVHFVVRDQKLGVIDLTIASDLQKMLRQFRYAVDQHEVVDMRQRFEQFRSTVEEIKKIKGERSLEIMGTEPALPPRA
jgi:hypothetical protein